jgi:hypothetical protein
MRVTKEERDNALASLRKFVKPGDTVYTILRHVSRSGMQREISLYARWGDDDGTGGLQWLDGWASKVLGERIGKREGLVVNGCGMDMGFHLVYNLSYTLWPEGFGCVGEKCPSNDHSNGDRDYTPNIDARVRCLDCVHGTHPHAVHTHDTHWHKDGGYALKQRWL